MLFETTKLVVPGGAAGRQPGRTDTETGVYILNKRRRIIISYVFLLILLPTLLWLSIRFGSVMITGVQMREAMLGGGDEIVSDILFRIRLPRALSATLLGGALALAGYLLQTYFHNPIAGPFILGISSGAKLAVAAALVAAMSHKILLSSGVMVLVAFAGAMAAIGFVILMAGIVDRLSILIISGVMIGYICSAITDLIVVFADDSNIVNLHNWSKGSFSGTSMEQVYLMIPIVFLSFAALLITSKQTEVYLMGEEYAASVGVNIKAYRVMLVLLSGILAACVTAFAGPISFVGIAVPHLMRKLLATSKPLYLIPACFLGGASTCLFCDLIARTVFAPTELGISTVTAFLGAPVVLMILLRRQQRKE